VLYLSGWAPSTAQPKAKTRGSAQVPIIDTYIHTCIHTYIHTYIHTCIHAYIHSYIHTKIYRKFRSVRLCPSTVSGPRPTLNPNHGKMISIIFYCGLSVRVRAGPKVKLCLYMIVKCICVMLYIYSQILHIYHACTYVCVCISAARPVAIEALEAGGDRGLIPETGGPQADLTDL
jgi:hypothetical protein